MCIIHIIQAKDTVREDKDGFRFMIGNADKYNKLLMGAHTSRYLPITHTSNGLIVIKNAKPIETFARRHLGV